MQAIDDARPCRQHGGRGPYLDRREPNPCADERSAPQKVVTIEGITEYHFDNGLCVLLFPDQSRSTVTVNMTVLVGSWHEGYGEAGMAHLLEHMLFKGTSTHPNIPQALRDRGARFNGTTTADRTNYFETVPASSENLEFCIRLEADRLVHSPIRQADIMPWALAGRAKQWEPTTARCRS